MRKESERIATAAIYHTRASSAGSATPQRTAQRICCKTGGVLEVAVRRHWSTK